MKYLGIILNVLGLICIIVFFFGLFDQLIYLNTTFADAIAAEASSVAIIGGAKGPTSIYAAFQLNYYGLFFLAFFIVVFVYNIYFFIKRNSKKFR